MKTDDPILTAYALGELPAGERASIEQLLREQPQAGTEISETREIAGILRDALHAEPAPPLAEHQRWAILRMAEAVQREARGVPARERDVVEPAWWGRVGVWQTIAACAVFGFGIYAFSVSLTKPSPSVGRTLGPEDMVVTVPGEAVPAVPGAPEILTPAELQQRMVAAGGPGVDAGKVFPNGALIVPPQLAGAVRIEAPQGTISTTAGNAAPASGVVRVTRENERTVISILDAARIARDGIGYATLPDVRKPAVVGSNQTSANASIGLAAAKPPSDEVFGTYLLQRMSEAERVREGSTAADFSKVFRADPKVPDRYEMIRCRSIKVDAKFEGGDGTAKSSDARVKTISRPYLDVFQEGAK